MPNRSALPAAADTHPDDSPASLAAPRWARIATALKGRILAGEWASGTAIAAESALAEHYGVALGTMRAAIQALVDQGLLERVHGRGTFVRGALTGATMARFFRFGDAGSEIPESRIVSLRTLAAPAEIAAQLGLAAGTPVLRLLRQRGWEGKVRLLETIWLPAALFSELATLKPAEFAPLLYPMYAERYGITVSRAIDDLRFARLGAREATQLGLPEGHPALAVNRVAFDLAGRRVEFRQTLGNADDFHYRAEVR
ncbi:GntR family transcriptional regulator [Cupriavidus basilensis]|uniref:GntR family transcriptional regulator n=1 Tax=Cupriavidus basilensis TaxID=68895 RepID=A0ABT6AVE8_9BURK|nr:GntR family transcriptional regulator [Cupriavidus basilensis]MDF3836596.1 GntR family transcriptional regulator [Cupriavidus basilensis]